MSFSGPAVTGSPLLPNYFSMPLRILPAALHGRVLLAALNRVFAEDVKQGEFDFMLERSVAIEVTDLRFRYCLTLRGDSLVAGSAQLKPDLSVRASLYDFMSLAARQQDPDTLVFQRRLVMEGDTELGLALKNYLDSMDFESSRVLSLVEQLSKKTLPVYKRLFA